MEKPAPTPLPLHPLLARRWSPRAFSPKPVEPEKLAILLEAVRWSPSSRNEQPCRLLITQQSNPTPDPHKNPFHQLLACLTPTNQPWAKHAPILFLLSAATHFAADNAPNPHALHDCGFAVASLTFQALALDLWVHQMAGFDPDQARATFHIPNEFTPLTVLALGYYGNPTTLEPHRQQQESAPRIRKPIQEFAFYNTWPPLWENLPG